MIISDIHKYVYIGIPRTGSKSMNNWLMEHFDGRWHGGHHDYSVPESAADYLIFTVVRNPYDRRVSGHFGICWGDQAPKDHELQPYSSEQERLRKSWAFMKAREKQVQDEMPQQSDTPLDDRIRDALLQNDSEGNGMNQNRFIKRAGVSLVLYYERLPECLAELPFVDTGRIPPFPHHPERGIRPKGTFFDLFKETDEEQVVWAHSAEDFETLGYNRFESSLPENAPCALRISQL